VIETTASVTAPRRTAEVRTDDARPGYGFDRVGDDEPAPPPGTRTTPRIVAASDEAATRRKTTNVAIAWYRMARWQSLGMVTESRRGSVRSSIGLRAHGLKAFGASRHPRS
jgi:hypothetical protein